MTMNFGISNMTIGDAAKNIAVEGGSVVAGLLGAGILGKQAEKRIGTAGSKAVTTTSPMTDKLIAYVANNGAKMALWYLLKKEGKVLGGYEKDIEKGIMASVAMDTIMRASNKFAPKPSVVIGGYEVLTGELASNIPQMNDNIQKVLQDNSALRSQLNSAMQKLANAKTGNINVTATPLPPQSHDTRFGMMGTPEDTRRRYGAMTPPIEEERNRNFGAMNKANFNFAGEQDNTATIYGML